MTKVVLMRTLRTLSQSVRNHYKDTKPMICQTYDLQGVRGVIKLTKS